MTISKARRYYKQLVEGGVLEDRALRFCTHFFRLTQKQVEQLKEVVDYASTT